MNRSSAAVPPPIETENIAFGTRLGSTNNTSGSSSDEGVHQRGANGNARDSLHYLVTDSILNTPHRVPHKKKGSDCGGDGETAETVNAGDNNLSGGSAINDHYDRFKKYAVDTKKDLRQKSCSDWLATFIPAVAWLRSYSWRTDLFTDTMAGLTVGIMVIPQSMSYAKLAGLPVEFGLYSSLVPIYAYSLFGSSRQLAVGPVALLSLMLSTALSEILPSTNGKYTDEQQAEYNILAIQAAMLVGVFYIVMGLLRLGFVTIFLSHAVISGFTSGAAVIIGLSQLKYILGYEIPRSKQLVPILYHTFANISQFNYKTFLMGASGVFALLTMKHIGKTYPNLKWVRAIGPLSVSAICILVTWAGSLDERGIPIVNYIPKGFPSITVSSWAPVNTELIAGTLSMVIVGFMESIAIAKQLASKHKYELDSSTELIGLGVANFMGAVFNCYPVTGSFSRSAVNNESGAKSGISGVVTATMVLITLLFLTTIFEYMPLATLAAIVISGVLGLLDYEEAIYLWRVHKFDWLVWMVSFMGTMFLGVEVGLMIAVGLSLLLVLYESAYPHTAVLGRLPGSTVYRNVKQYPEAERYDGIVICRIDAPIYFANTQYIRDKLNKYEEVSARSSRIPIQFVIVDFSPVSYIDTSALHILEDIRKDYQSRGVTLCLSNPSRAVMHRLVLDGLADKIGHENIFVSTHDALREALSLISRKVDVDLEGATIDQASPSNSSDDFKPNDEGIAANNDGDNISPNNLEIDTQGYQVGTGSGMTPIMNSKTM